MRRNGSGAGGAARTYEPRAVDQTLRQGAELFHLSIDRIQTGVHESQLGGSRPAGTVNDIHQFIETETVRQGGVAGFQ